MAAKKMNFEKALEITESVVKSLGLEIRFTHNLDPFFKGDFGMEKQFLSATIYRLKKNYSI